MSRAVVDERRVRLQLAVAGAITFGALLASYTTFRPIRDALILDGNPDQIPLLFTATFIAISIVSPLWSALLAPRHGVTAADHRRRYVPRSFHAFALCGFAFAAIVHAEIAPVWVGRVFYVWSAVFNLFVISVFWSLLADLVGPTRAGALYGPIAAGGTVGAIVGPALTRILVDDIGVPGILATSAFLLELAVLGVWQVRRYGEQLPEEAVIDVAPADNTQRTPALRGLAQVARSPYLLALVGYVLCTAIAATFMYVEQARLAKTELPDRETRAELFATIDLWTSVGTFVLQTFIAGRLIRWLGPAVVLAILPLSQGIGITSVLLAPSLATLVAVQIATRAATHGLTRPARELLFTVVSPDEKYRAKNVIDTMVYRFGDFASAWLHKGLVAIGSASAVIGATLPIVAAWIALAAVLGAGFRRRTRVATGS